jgi:hypothetical protein
MGADIEVEDRLVGIPQPQPLEGRNVGKTSFGRIGDAVGLVRAAQAGLVPLIRGGAGPCSRGHGRDAPLG